MLLKSDDISIIEYAAFWGAIQIFQYLLKNGVDIDESLWLYGIHSNNSEVIHLIEDDTFNFNFKACLKEAIKCHHNNIADYIIDNFELSDDGNEFELPDDGNEFELPEESSKFENNIDSYGIHYHNYYFYTDKQLSEKDIFLYLAKYNYFNLVKLYLKHRKIDLTYGIVFFHFL